MEIRALTAETELKKGDLLLVAGPSMPGGVAAYTIKKFTDCGEIILDCRKNIYVNRQMYLDGQSWAKDIRVVSEK